MHKKIVAIRFIDKTARLIAEGLIEQEDLIRVIRIAALMFPETTEGMKPVDDWNIEDCNKWYFDIMLGGEIE